MDEIIEKALEFSNFSVTLNNQKRILKEKCKEELNLYYKGGKFTVTRELLNFCWMLLSKSYERTVIIDDNDTPVEIEDIHDFFEKLQQQYADATNKYLNDYKELTKKRSIEGFVDV